MNNPATHQVRIKRTKLLRQLYVSSKQYNDNILSPGTTETENIQEECSSKGEESTEVVSTNVVFEEGASTSGSQFTWQLGSKASGMILILFESI